MFNWRQFPFTNFNELNLDWIMKRLKSLSVTVDTKFPELEKKLDDTYDFITNNLQDIVEEMLPEVVQDIAAVIKDVTWFGAVGDGVTDDSASVEAAIEAGDIIYFPAGRYLLNDITVNKPLVIMGDGESSVLIPTRIHAGTNQFGTMFTFNDSIGISNIKLWADNSVEIQSGTQTYLTAAFVANGVNHVHFDHVIFDHIFETYHKSQGDLDFPLRHGMAVYTFNCETVCFTDCEIREYGGEELIQIERDRASFGDGTVFINNCSFHDRHSGDKGSALNVLGGTLLFTNNSINNFDNVYTGDTLGGSLFNLCSAYTVICNNYFHNCLCGNYIDVSENYYTKAEYVLVIGNVFDGRSKTPLHVHANYFIFNDNYFVGALGIRSMLMTDEITATAQYGGVYSVDASTKFSYSELYICDNIFRAIATPYGADQTASYDTILGLGQHPAGQDPVQPRIIISGNEFEVTAASPATNTIFFASKVGRTYIKDNLFRLTGLSYPDLSGARCYISGVDIVSYLNIIGNIFDCSYDGSVDTYLVSGSASFRSDSYYLISDNVAIITHSTGSPGTVYACSGSPTHLITNNNTNIT